MMTAELKIEQIGKVVFEKRKPCGKVQWIAKHAETGVELLTIQKSSRDDWEVVRLEENPNYAKPGHSYEKQFKEIVVSGKGLDLREAKRLAAAIIDISTIEPKRMTIAQLILAWDRGTTYAPGFADCMQRHSTYVSRTQWFSVTEKERSKFANQFSTTCETKGKSIWNRIAEFNREGKEAILNGSAIELEARDLYVDGAAIAQRYKIANPIDSEAAKVYWAVDPDLLASIHDRYPQAKAFALEIGNDKPLVWWYGGKVVAGLMPLAKD